MFQRIDFTKDGGFPLTQKTMAFVQDSYNDVLAALSRSIGDYVIISGVTVVSPNVYSNGWVTYNGSIIPFSGGTGQTYVEVEEIDSTETFGDGAIYTVNYTNRAKFNAISGITFSSFKRLSLASLDADIDAVEVIAQSGLTKANSVQTQLNNFGSVPQGGIIIWSGPANAIPAGWGLCDGSVGRPDLRERFVVGAGGDNPGVTGTTGYAVNAIGGLNRVRLITSELPSHTHSYVDDYLFEANTSGDLYPGSVVQTVSGTWLGVGSRDNDNDTFIGRNKTTGAVGGAATHENRPPYYALCYIIKL